MIQGNKALIVEPPKRSDIKQALKVAGLLKDQGEMIVVWDLFNNELMVRKPTDHIQRIGKGFQARSLTFSVHVQEDLGTVRSIEKTMQEWSNTLNKVSVETSVNPFMTERLVRLLVEGKGGVDYKSFFPLTMWSKDNIDQFYDAFVNLP